MATTATPLNETKAPAPRKNALHEAVDFLLHHQAVHNPDTAKEAEGHRKGITGFFSQIDVPTER
jgi:hypothetical protein